MPFKIIRNDITCMTTDAVVNAANNGLLPGGGVCGAIFSAAGYNELRAECERIGFCATGSAVITKGYALKAKYIIHAVGPIYRDGNEREAEELYSCYTSSLKLAKEYSLSSIAFPLISSGIYGYPKREALKIATNAIVDFLSENEMDVYLVVYDKNSFEVSASLFSDVKAYIDETLVHEEDRKRRGDLLNEQLMKIASRYGREKESSQLAPPDLLDTCFEETPDLSVAMPPEKSQEQSLDDMFKTMDRSFSEELLALVTESGMKDSEVYKKANVDRRLFSKIRSDVQYKPSKTTAVAFALALELDMQKTRDLIGKAGYSMTHSNKFDIIIEYFITHGIYNVFEINEVLFAFDQNLIGA